jgi:hypothetical protein
MGQVADALALPGFIFGGWGLWVTYRQAAGAKTEAQAASAAASQATAAISRSNLLVASKDLQAAEKDILDAALRKSVKDAAHACRVWRASAGIVRGLLDAAGLSTRDLSATIQDSVALAAQVEREARSSEIDSERPLTTVNQLLEATANVMYELSALTSRESHRPRGEQ